MATPKKSVKIIGNVPAVAADGHGLGLNPKDGTAQLMFIQAIRQTGKQTKEIEANVVSSIRLSFEQLENLNNDITSAIAQYKKSQKK